MSKNSDEKLNKWLSEVKHWEKVRDEAINKLKELAGISQKTEQPTTALPEGVTLMNAVVDVFKENPESQLKILDVVNKIGQKYGNKPERKNVQSTIRYLTVVKRLLDKVKDQRGYYSLMKH